MQRSTTVRGWVTLVAILFTVGACSADADDLPNIEPQVSAEQSPEITDITEDLFGAAHYVGQTVTVTGKVTRIITPTSFILTGDEYDDDSILVLSAGKYDPELYRQLTVTGEVQRFSYPNYRGYELGDDDAYGEFNGREFIVAGPPSRAESATPSPS